jgi:hypothetical protein
MEQANQTTKLEQLQYYRFQINKAQKNDLGKIEKTNTVGMAYLGEGHGTYSIRLWTFVNERFFMVMDKYDSSRFVLMTREPNRNPQAKRKYFWSVIGSGRALSSQNVIELNFDLLPEPLYLNVFPEENTNAAFRPSLDDVLKAA